jgi:hypothetical protein
MDVLEEINSFYFIEVEMEKIAIDFFNEQCILSFYELVKLSENPESEDDPVRTTLKNVSLIFDDVETVELDQFSFNYCINDVEAEENPEMDGYYDFVFHLSMGKDEERYACEMKITAKTFSVVTE